MGKQGGISMTHIPYKGSGPPRFPNVPTFAEAGAKGMEADAWIGMWVK